MKTRRFLTGCIAALIFPLLKVFQNGTSIDVTLYSSLGFLLPFLTFSIFIGIYAIIVEHKEEDMKRLFRNCLTIPAFVVNIGTGDTSAIADVYTCTPKSEFKVGLESAWGILANSKEPKYLLLSKDRHTGDYIISGDVRYYVVRELQKPVFTDDGYVLYNITKCELMERLNE